MKVAKFGGSSVANATQFRKVGNIIQSDCTRKFIVVSAPGKRYEQDTKITDHLIDLYEKYIDGDNYQTAIFATVERYRGIATELDIKENVIDDIQESLESLLEKYKDEPNRLGDALKASGEDNNAKLMAAYLRSIGLKATYVHPKEAGIFVTDEPGNAQILSSAYAKIYELRQREGVLVIPGFFGVTENGDIVTFSRGGSDITGSIIAAGVHADLYENFTDVDSIFCVNPSLVENPQKLVEITYREMRELSYAGFSVFHDEALQPVYARKIPVNVKNTNNPSAPGTLIVAKRDYSTTPIAGIAYDRNFCSINISKYLMNREIGFGRKVLEILEEEGLSYEHTPSGIDDMSVILRSPQVKDGMEERITKRLYDELKVDDVTFEYDLALVMVVGEGMQRSVGIAAKAAVALAEASVNLEMINQGSSEVSMMFGVKEDVVRRAVASLYYAYFSEQRIEVV